MGFFDFFSNESETRELHSVGELRTRYYKTSFKKVRDQLQFFCDDNKIEIKHIDEVHGEMFLQTGKFHIIVSIVQVTPLETAVDLKVQTYKLIGMNAPKKQIVKIYQFLDSKLPFKGTSLHP